MLWSLFVAAAALSQQSVAVAEMPNLRLVEGSTAEIRANEKGYLLSGAEAAPLMAGERDLLSQLLGSPPEEAMGGNSKVVHSDGEGAPIVPGVLRFSLIDYKGEMVLLVLNGMKASYMYKARIGRGDGSQVTDVCQLLPNNRNMEHWPYKFDWIEVTEIREVPYRAGEPARCE